MIRRDFFKTIAKTFLGFFGLKLVAACGQDDVKSAQAASGLSLAELPETVKIWSYYVPLSSYNGIIEEFEGRHALDRRVLFEKVSAVTTRISGRRNDGTENRANIKISDLRAAEGPIRVPFWHDDTDTTGARGHTLHLFSRYLQQLDAGEKVYIATGMILNHFHVVMLDPTAAGLKKIAGAR
jgi:hypothetical protein